MTAIIAHKIDLELRNGNQDFLIDGYPRTVESAELFERVISKPAMVPVLDCSKEVAEARFVDRKRGDDDAAVFAKRYEEYQRLNPQICARYANVERKVSCKTPPTCVIALTTDSWTQARTKQRRMEDFVGF